LSYFAGLLAQMTNTILMSVIFTIVGLHMYLEGQSGEEENSI
jgi:hypothetical protein